MRRRFLNSYVQVKFQIIHNSLSVKSRLTERHHQLKTVSMFTSGSIRPWWGFKESEDPESSLEFQDITHESPPFWSQFRLISATVPQNTNRFQGLKWWKSQHKTQSVMGDGRTAEHTVTILLCRGNLGEMFSEILSTMMRLVLRASSALQHRLLTEVDDFSPTHQIS